MLQLIVLFFRLSGSEKLSSILSEFSVKEK